MPDTNENIDEQAKPVEPTEPAEPTKVAGAKKPMSTVGLPVFIACVAAAAIVGVLCGHFLLGGGSGFSLGGTTQLTADQLDTVIAEYTYNGKTEKVTARQVIAQNGSVESSANSDGSYNVPAATDVVSYARNQIVLSAADAQGITVSDDDVDAYANSMFGTTDYSTIASQYNIDEDTAKQTIKQSAVMSKLRDSVVTTTLPEAAHGSDRPGRRRRGHPDRRLRPVHHRPCRRRVGRRQQHLEELRRRLREDARLLRDHERLRDLRRGAGGLLRRPVQVQHGLQPDVLRVDGLLQRASFQRQHPDRLAGGLGCASP